MFLGETYSWRPKRLNARLVPSRASIEFNLLSLSPRLINSDWVRVCLNATGRDLPLKQKGGYFAYNLCVCEPTRKLEFQ